MKIATILMYAFGVVMVMIIVGVSLFIFHKESFFSYALLKTTVVLLVFLAVVYFARESGRGEPMNFKEVLQRHGDNTEWEILTEGLCSKVRWTGLICECRTDKKYFVYFAEKDIPEFEKKIKKLSKYFTAHLLQDPEYSYILYSI